MLTLVIGFLLIQNSHPRKIKNVLCKEQFPTLGNKCVYISPISQFSKTWVEASEICNKMDGQLFVSSGEGQFVHQLSAYIKEHSLNCYNDDGICVSGRWVNRLDHSKSSCPVLDTFEPDIRLYPCHSHIFPYICELTVNPKPAESTYNSEYNCNCGVNSQCSNFTGHGYCECRPGYVGNPRLHCYEYMPILSTISLLMFVTTIFYMLFKHKKQILLRNNVFRHYPPEYLQNEHIRSISVIQTANAANGFQPGVSTSPTEDKPPSYEDVTREDRLQELDGGLPDYDTAIGITMSPKDGKVEFVTRY